MTMLDTDLVGSARAILPDMVRTRRAIHEAGGGLILPRTQEVGRRCRGYGEPPPWHEPATDLGLEDDVRVSSPGERVLR